MIDVRRMNVALTRAKASLFVLGSAPTLERSDDIWRKIVDNARSRSSLIKVSCTQLLLAVLMPTCLQIGRYRILHSSQLLCRTVTTADEAQAQAGVKSCCRTSAAA